MSKHDSCCTAVAICIKTSILIVAKTGKLYNMRHCKIRFRTLLPLYNFFRFSRTNVFFFYAHTVTVLISQFFSLQTASYQCRRGVSVTISLWHTDQKNADGNSHLATRLHTLRTYLCIKPKQTSTRRKHEDTIPAQPYGQPRAGYYARAYNLVRRQTICRWRSDAAAL